MDLQFDNSALDSSHSCGYREAYEALQDFFKDQIAQLQDQLDSHKAEINQLKKSKFGRRSESLPREKPDKPELTDEEKLEKREKSDEKRAATRKKRKELPARHFVVEIPANQRDCPSCEKPMNRWQKYATSVTFVFVPGHFEQRLYHREVLSCHCSNGIVKAPPPRRPFQGGQKFDAGIVADLIVRKCADSMPLFRLVKAYRRQNMTISESTLGRIFQEAGLHLKIVWQHLCRRIAAQELVLADETPVKLTDHPKREAGKCKLGYMWVFLAPDIKSFVYIFNVSRSSETPVQILGGTTGTLVVDGYSGYNTVTTPDTRTRAGCNIHARRKFIEIEGTFKKEAQAVRDFYKRIYAIEHRAKEEKLVGTAKHLELRQTLSAPVMEEFKEWLKETRKLYLPTSALVKKAIHYTENQWEALTRFLTDPKIPPDNNLSEQKMRSIALGRKNWLFLGNEGAGEVSAILHTLVLNCEAHGVNPQAYLTDLVMQDPATLRERVCEFLPSTWKPPDGFTAGNYPLYSEEYLVTEIQKPPS
jgi:transposase